MTASVLDGNLGGMHTPVRPPGPARPLIALVLATACALIAGTTASAFGGGWAPPRPVFIATVVPSHEMTTDASGMVHIASDRGSSGIWYITNSSGTWTECQVSEGDDRRPSIAMDGSTVHIAFARMTDGEQGIYTASSDQPGSPVGCGWTITPRYAGSASDPSMQVRGGTLSVAFRTGDRKLRFMMGPANAAGWTVSEVIDRTCCTSPVALALTDGGAPRVAYGDGASRAQGLKFAVRTKSGWRTSKAHGGRVKQVAMVLDQLPGLFGQPPSNAPSIAFVAARQGAYLATKSNDGPRGAWGKRFLSRAFGPLDLTNWSNVTYIVFAKNGDLEYARGSGGIWLGGKLSGRGRDGQPQLSGGQLTFTHRGARTGIYHTHGM
jgi:hypothetical protein